MQPSNFPSKPPVWCFSCPECTGQTSQLYVTFMACGLWWLFFPLFVYESNSANHCNQPNRERPIQRLLQVLENTGGKELCYVFWRWSLNKWVLSLLRKMASDSAVLTLVGSSFHHWGATTEKSGSFAERHLLALSDGGTSRHAYAGACGLTSVWG